MQKFRITSTSGAEAKNCYKDRLGLYLGDTVFITQPGAVHEVLEVQTGRVSIFSQKAVEILKIQGDAGVGWILQSHGQIMMDEGTLTELLQNSVWP